MSMKVTAAPTVEPATAAECKLVARLTASGLDSLITSDYIPAARRLCEQRTQRYLTTQTVTLTLEDWPRSDCIEIPRGPILSVTSIVYRDTTGSSQTLSSSWYEFKQVSDSVPPEISLLPGYTWPSLGDYEDAVIVTMQAGYGASASSIPHDLRMWVMAAAAEMIRTGSFDIPRDFCAGLLDGQSIVSV
jgi:uncharacterized phiE125 gp8 family phage protein